MVALWLCKKESVGVLFVHFCRQSSRVIFELLHTQLPWQFSFPFVSCISSACKVVMLQACPKCTQEYVESNAQIVVKSECSDKIATSAPHKCSVVSFCALGQCNREIWKQCQFFFFSFFLKLGHQCFLCVTSLVHPNADLLMVYLVWKQTYFGIVLPHECVSFFQLCTHLLVRMQPVKLRLCTVQSWIAARHGSSGGTL